MDRTKGRASQSNRTATLQIGDAAPEISLKSHTGSDWKLSDSKGKNVVLAFYPFAFSEV